MSIFLDPIGISTGESRIKLTAADVVKVVDAEQKTYTANFSNGGIIIVTGYDGYIYNDYDNGSTSDLVDSNYSTGKKNALDIYSLKIDGVICPTDNSKGGYGGIDIIVPGFGDPISVCPYFEGTGATYSHASLSRYIFPVYNSIEIKYRRRFYNVGSNFTGKYVFYKYEYVN